jgi:pyruvate dehydrogenase E2 component (dihydrolipoamide acetyltransferase)
MAEEVILPKWGLTMEDAVVHAWRKQEGEAVTAGEVLVEIETDKITTELEAPLDGYLAKIMVQAEETVPVGAVLALIAATPDEAAAIRQTRQ